MNSPDARIPDPPSWREYLDARLEPLATKEALQELRADLQREIQDVRAELQREIRDAKVEIIKWNIGTLIAGGGLVWAIVARGAG